jgi:hypothetical protein
VRVRAEWTEEQHQHYDQKKQHQRADEGAAGEAENNQGDYEEK